jgi:hypothetical protein
MHDLMLCTSCGSLSVPVKKHKGSFLTEAVMLLGAIIGGLINIVLGAFIFIALLVYGVWRITSKHKACEICSGVNLIPANSPIAQQFLNDRNG